MTAEAATTLQTEVAALTALSFIPQRTEMLATRGLVEMLFQKAERAQYLLTHARYQATLKTKIEGTAELIESSAASLKQVLDAIETQVRYLEPREDIALAALPIDDGVRDALSRLLAGEMKNHADRVAAIRKKVAEWRSLLEG